MDRLWACKYLDEDPDMICQIHKEFYQAGADFAVANSYKLSQAILLETGRTQEEADRLGALAIQLAHKAREEFWNELEDKSNRIKPFVVASVGPYAVYVGGG